MSQEKSIFDLRYQLAFYKAYHNNTANVLIHSVFVPTILFSSTHMLSKVSLSSASPYCNLAGLIGIGFSAFYIRLAPVPGLLATGILFYATKYLTTSDISVATSAAVFTFAWIMQFIGHGVFEKRKPALLDSLVQSLVAAPFFILFEGLFLLGFYPNLKKQLQTDVDQVLAEMKQKKA